ncbi:single-stranded DNA-binding protein [Caldisalinibacter kiritimatiensis]|uniref:Single-stranded DNA-binding protein n=1 Tax=Caldisalinibacter kiritimatiensis TaxID=1304284 RepID=R1ASC7_9FIRM|nr:single-stranded DNA-binding protein [Caldisalinibacter kiritimatiensis]EOD00033.1 Single-stranded DNA-binding protein [Caldisalinibacter kiritimatiensis]
MNSVVLIGRLTRDPELRFLPGNGRAVATFTIAVDRPFTNAQGEREADFLRIVVWGRQAENCANYLGKGRLVGVQGRIQTRSYDTNQGDRRYVTEIVADRVQFLDWGDSNQGNVQGTTTQDDFVEADGFHPVDNDDIPF